MLITPRGVLVASLVAAPAFATGIGRAAVGAATQVGPTFLMGGVARACNSIKVGEVNVQPAYCKDMSAECFNEMSLEGVASECLSFMTDRTLEMLSMTAAASILKTPQNVPENAKVIDMLLKKTADTPLPTTVINHFKQDSFLRVIVKLPGDQSKRVFVKEVIKYLNESICGLLSNDVVSHLQPDAFEEVSDICFSKIQPDVFASVTPEMFAALPPRVFTVMTAAQLSRVPMSSVVRMTALQAASLGNMTTRPPITAVNQAEQSSEALSIKQKISLQPCMAVKTLIYMEGVCEETKAALKARCQGLWSGAGAIAPASMASLIIVVLTATAVLL